MATRVPSSLVTYVRESAERAPDRVAVVDPRGWHLSYAQLDEQSDRIAGYLVEAGIVPGDRVAVVCPKGARGIAAFIGIMKARAAYVPIDYTAPVERNRSIMVDGEVRVAFVTQSGADVLTDWPADIPRPTLVVVDDVPAGVDRRHAAWDDVVAHAPGQVAGATLDDLAYILYTSGSTGVPKGVMLTQRNAVSFVEWCSEVFEPTPDDRFSSHAPFHFDLSILDIYVPFKHAAALHIVSEELGKSPKDLAAFIADSRLTVWYSTPSILALLAQFGDLASRDYSALRIVLFAGEVFPVKHLRDLVQLWPKPVYYNLYGPTETNVCTFARIPTPVPPDRTTPYPIGFPCSHCTALVLDGDGVEVAEGEEGLLYIAGASVFPGYRNRPEQNANAFTDRDGIRWYNTGDVVRFVPGEGYIYLGRRDRMVKRRGYRIELGEIERGLYQHPAIGEAAVIAVPDESSGVRILAYLSARSSSRPSIIELKTFCAQRLPSYMSPDAFVFLEALPRTSTNKVDYQGLSHQARATA